ncbi:MAG: hypothetical protein IKT84_06075 [Bacteroidales bacterium]|nr:hypothetical protein [Bacteroidales bacterium]
MKKTVLIFLVVCAFVFNIHAQNEINGHEYVDLGLSVKWATCNVGANAPHEYGNYYAWGETETKNSYNKSNSLTYRKVRENISGDASRDASRANWGTCWRMPTKEEMLELINGCNWTWTTQNGTRGYKVIGRNGNSIFLPAAGGYDATTLGSRDKRCFYWTSTPESGLDHFAWVLCTTVNNIKIDWTTPYYGFPIRPVSKPLPSY